MIPNVNPLQSQAIQCPCGRRGASLLFVVGPRNYWICMPCGARAMEEATWANVKFMATPIAELIARAHQGSC